jgi:hypothetical protein
MVRQSGRFRIYWAHALPLYAANVDFSGENKYHKKNDKTSS